jgi:hypothetical protein
MCFDVKFEGLFHDCRRSFELAALPGTFVDGWSICVCAALMLIGTFAVVATRCIRHVISHTWRSGSLMGYTTEAVQQKALHKTKGVKPFCALVGVRNLEPLQLTRAQKVNTMSSKDGKQAQGT